MLLTALVTTYLPLTDGPWQPIPEGDVLAVRQGCEIMRHSAQDAA